MPFDASCSPSQLGDFLHVIAKHLLFCFICKSHGAMIGRRRPGGSLLMVSSLGLRHLGTQPSVGFLLQVTSMLIEPVEAY